eukprot:375625-Ditylum_brightwellii.AAC.1
MIVDEFPGIRIVLTGSYASWLNGKIECPHKILENGTRATLMDAGKETTYWYYAYIDAIRKYNCILHSSLGNCPDFIWYNITPSIHQLIPWGSVIYPCLHNSKALDKRLFEGYYFGTCNNNSLVEWFDPDTWKVKHCQTAKFDEFCIHTLVMTNQCLVYLLLEAHH